MPDKSVGTANVVRRLRKMHTYKSSSYHLSGQEFHVAFVLVTATRLALGENISQVVEKESRVAAVRQAGILLLGDFLVHIQAILAKLVEQRTAKIARVGHVGDLLELGGQLDGDQLSEARKLDVRVTFRTHGTELLPVSPDVSVRNGKKVCS